jgi:hypothetical protein
MPKFFSELQEAHLENLSSDPSTPAVGRIWNNTTSNKPKVYDGTDNKVLVSESGTATLTNKTLTSPVVNTPTIDVITLDGQASTPSNPSAGFYKVYVKDDGKAYILNQSGLEAGLGGGGGGGSLRFIEAANSPIKTFENEIEVYEFTPGEGQSLYLSLRVPAGYTAGSPLRLNILWTCASTSGDALINSVATLIRSEVDEITSTTNQHTSTNAAITLSSANDLEPQKVVLDISDGDGEINSVALSAGDLIKIKLQESSSTVADAIKLIPDASEITIS